MISSWPSYKSAAFNTALSNEIFLCGYLEANKYPNCIVYCMILRENISVLWESLTGIFFITRASVYGKPMSENATDFLSKRGVMVPGVPCVPGIDRGNLGRERDIACSWHNSVFCWRKLWQAKYRALYVHLAYKDAHLFPQGSVLELYSWKPAR